MNDKRQPFSLTHQIAIPPQHPGQANQLTIGTWGNERVAVKKPNPTHDGVKAFYAGVNALFHARLGDSYHYVNMYRLLSVHCTLPIPELLTVDPQQNGSYMPVHRYIEGTAAKSFQELSHIGARELGKSVATIHTCQVNGYGIFGGLEVPAHFHRHMAETIQMLLENEGLFSHYDQQTKKAAQESIRILTALPRPKHIAPIMLDMDPSQYFISNGVPTALIDIDFFAFGPPEFELVVLESLLPAHLAPTFILGYEQVRPFPTLDRVRRPYRTLARLLCLQGPLPFDEWGHGLATFDTRHASPPLRKTGSNC